MSGSLPVRGGSRVTVIALVLSTMTVWFGASRTQTTAAAPASPSSSAAVSSGTAPANTPAPPSSRDPPAAPDTIAAVPANAAPMACADRLLHPLFDFVDVPERRGAKAELDDESDDSPEGGDASADLVRYAKAAARDLRGALGSGAAFDAIVATIVDPIDSGMSYRFDTALEALSLGVEESADGLPAYFRDRSWLPWDDREASPTQQVESQSCRTTTPGLLVFRTSTPGDIPAADRPVALLLLLVGETPTTGIHVDAMVSALRAARALTCADPRGCNPIQLVAPTFSGSVSSLRVALKAWEERAPSDHGEVHIVTGSATGSDVPRLLASLKLARHEVTFTSTTAPSASAECAYLDFLQHHLGIEPEPRSPGGPPTVLPGVAMLHESGTEFGHVERTRQRVRSRPCDTVPDIDVTFPLHISSLRDAYEDIERKEAAASPGLARPTNLDISLREKGPPLDTEGDPSPRTTYAQDIALQTMLDAVGAEGVRHVAIVATDIADAIFLARKVRDVAPDVRLAFFSPDVLLLHPSYKRDLLGSIIVSPYPFLGSDDFDTSVETTHRHMTFENASAEGIFNAVLVARGAKLDQLFEYSFMSHPGPAAALPMWISAIARTGIVPISVHATVDCNDSIFPRVVTREAATAPACLARDSGAVRPPGPLRELDRAAISNLHVHSDATPPRFWHFLFVALLVAGVVDALRQKRTYDALDPRPMPDPITRENDQQADLAISRTKWLLYATIRTFVLTVAIVYMSAVYFMIWLAYPSQAAAAIELLLVPGVLVSALAVAASVFTGTVFVRELRAFRKAARAAMGQRRTLRPRAPPALSQSLAPHSVAGSPQWLRGHKLLLELGFAEAVDRPEVGFTSFAQIRMLLVLSGTVALGLCYLLVSGMLNSGFGWESTPRLTLFVLRSVPLLSGVSPLAPAFLAMACVYAWSVSRMARLYEVHALSRMALTDGLEDLVSTPIRAVLYPRYAKETATEGFTRTERAALNSILRPCTGPRYLAVLGANLFLPVVLGVLKPPSTLERGPETILLFATMALCVVLIGATVAQLLQYWWALRRLLQRITAHPLRSSFSRIGPFARRSVDERVAGTPLDLLRLSGAAVQFDDLLKSAERPGLCTLRGKSNLAALRVGVAESRRRALSSAANREIAKSAADLAGLGGRVLEAAQRTMELLERAYAGELGAPDGADAKGAAERAKAKTSPEGAEAKGPPESEQREGRHDAPGEEASSDEPSGTPKEVDDAFAAVAWRFTAAELRWLREAEAFVATVVTLLVERHVRQFQHFLYGLTASVLLLLAAFGSYSFEPHRLLLTCLWGVTGTVIVSGLYVFVGLDRNTLLSLVAGTPPGRVTLDAALAVRLATWVGVPLLGIAAAQYPEVANALGRLVEPFTHLLR